MVLSLVVGAGVCAIAQIPDDPSQETRIEVGPTLLYPFFDGSIERTDNLYLSNTEEGGGTTAATIATAVGGLIADLPFSHSRARVAYAAAYGAYGQADLPSHLNHYARADLDLVFGNGWFLSVLDDYARGVLDVRLFDPGGELTFTGERFEWNTARVEFGAERERSRRLAFEATFATNRVLGERVSGLYDSDEATAKVIGEHTVGPLLGIVWELSSRAATLESPTLEPERKDVDGGAARCGAVLRLGPASTLLVWAGYARYSFQTDEGDTSFRGLVGSVDLQRDVPGRARFSLALQRDAYPTLAASASVGDYYLSRQIRFQAQSAAASRLVLGAAAYYYVNAYPVEEQPRDDRSRSVEGWIGWKLRTTLEWRCYFSWAYRASTDPLYDYSARVYGTALRFGS